MNLVRKDGVVIIILWPKALIGFFITDCKYRPTILSIAFISHCFHDFLFIFQSFTCSALAPVHFGEDKERIYSTSF